MKNINSWLIYPGTNGTRNRFSVTLNDDTHFVFVQSVKEGDGVLIVDNDSMTAFSFARIYRIRNSLSETTFFFDGVFSVDGKMTLPELGIVEPEFKASMVRLEWSIFEATLKAVCGIAFDALPILDSDSSELKAYVRELMHVAMIDDLLGPAAGPAEEIIGMSVRDRYLVGKLAPQNAVITEEDELPGAGAEDEQEGTREVDASTNQSLVPSSLGFTFCVDSSVDKVELIANWGRYERTESERINEANDKPLRCWKRIPPPVSGYLSPL